MDRRLFELAKAIEMGTYPMSDRDRQVLGNMRQGLAQYQGFTPTTYDLLRGLYNGNRQFTDLRDYYRTIGY